MEWASEEADDPLYGIRGLTQRARTLMDYGQTDVGLGLIERAIDAVDGSTSGHLAVLGAAHLCGSIVAARGMKPEEARQHIAEARLISKSFTRESPEYGTLFGPGNVSIHTVAAELEAGDPFEAKHGAKLRLPAGVSAPRKGHHYQDLARAQVLAGDIEGALKSLNTARRVAPQQTRTHPSVRETTRAIAAAERRKTDSLAAFASWLGIRLTL